MLKTYAAVCAAVAAAGLGCASARPADARPPAAAVEDSVAFARDFDAAWSFVRDSYAYFDKKRTDWARVREIYRARAEQARSKRDFVGVLEEMMEELYDPHAHLGVNTPSSPRLVPSGTDLWGEWHDGAAIITDVRRGSGADLAGVRAGMEIVSINDVPVREVVRARLPKALSVPDPAADDWALRAALAGRRNAAVRVQVRDGSGTRVFEFEPGVRDRPEAPLTAKVIEGNVGYVRVHNALGDTATIAAWDSALVELRDTRALILDLRDTPSGGNSTVARGILGRLVTEEKPYQRHELVNEARRFGVRRVWVEHVVPRGPFAYSKPVVVLVGRWTGSMGEGVAIGLHGMQRATVMGTRMAGLLGATHGTTLPSTGFELRVPAERLYHVHGTPREEFVPSVVRRRTGETAVDDVLESALALIRARE